MMRRMLLSSVLNNWGRSGGGRGGGDSQAKLSDMVRELWLQLKS